MSDDVAHPTHYSRLTPEPIDVMRQWNMNFNLGCAMKYIARAGHKQGEAATKDLKKAAFYLQHEIDFLSKKETP